MSAYFDPRYTTPPATQYCNDATSIGMMATFIYLYAGYFIFSVFHFARARWATTGGPIGCNPYIILGVSNCL